MSVQDKVVVVTGAHRGHGRSIAVTFASEGAKLALIDIAPLDQTADECRARGVEVLPLQVDVRDPEQVKSAIDQIQQHYGRIDVLVNDAAIVTHFRYAGVQRWPRLAEMEPEFFERVIRTNLLGTFHTVRYTLPYMEAQGGGHIINFGQGNVGRGVHRGPVGAAVYHTSKVAIRAFTQELASEELDKNVCVLSFGPGGPGGDDRDEMTPEEVSDAAAQIDTHLGMRVVWAAEAPMELSGRMIRGLGEKLELAPDEV
jgi:dihydroxycyclohexadiene carboxylate dehydrogenase